ncbi:MAG: carboxypeptidase regulatory-like domain-containing protein [Planctomycetes bacterium]|nr:carboxypeptidase regulatory-like domain-containing protein [Planctomycetota bacterium]
MTARSSAKPATWRAARARARDEPAALTELAACAARGAQVAAGVRLAGDGRLSGNVLVRGSGAGLPGARVELLPLPPAGASVLGRVLRLARLDDGILQRVRPVAVTYTDPNGAFEYEGVRAGEYYVDVESDYHLLEAPQRVGVYASGRGGPVDVWVREGGRVLGQVVDGEERPVARARVVLVPGPNLFLESAREGSLHVLEAEADDEGRFAFGGVAPGRGYDVTATAPRIAISHLSGVDVARGEDTRVVLRARRGGTILGRVFSARVEEDGAERGRVPLPGAHVGVVPRGLRDLRFAQEILEQTHAVTDEDGAYAMTRVPPGDVDVVVYAPGHVLGAGALVVVGEGQTASAAPIVLERGATLRGRVVDSSGAPIAGVHVFWPTIDFSAMRRRGMDMTFAPFLAQAVEGFAFPFTDADGRFEAGPFPGDPPYRLRFYKEGYQETSLEAAPDAGELEVVLSTGGAVEGVVMDLDEAVPVTSFSVRSIDRIETRADAPGRFNPFSGGQVFEDPAGRFRIDAMSAGSVELTFSAPGYMPARVRDVVVQEGETTKGLIVTLSRGGIVRGTVLDEQGAPVAGATVMAFDPRVERGGEFRRGMRGQRDPFDLPDRLPRPSEGLPPALLGYAAGLGLLVDESARTAPDGSFELGGLREGPQYVVAFHPEYAPATSAELRLEPGVDVEGVVLELTRGASVFGTVKDRHGLPVTDTMVLAVSPTRFDDAGADAAGGGLYQTQTDAEGAYELEHMAAGSYFLVSTRGDEALNPLSFFATLDFDLISVPAGERVRWDIVDESLGGTRVFGRVLEDGQPVTGVQVSALGWEADNLLGVAWKVAKSDGVGGYEFAGLAPGEYQFQLMGLGPPVRLSVDVPDLSEYRFDLAVPAGRVEGRLVDDTSGAPLAGTRVLLRPLDEVRGEGLVASLIQQGGTLYRERSDADGRFAFARLAAGSYELSVEPRGEPPLAAPAPLRFELGPDEVRRDVELRLARAAELAGTVLDAGGAPVEGATVLCRREDGAAARPREATSGADGSFVVTGLSVGAHVVQATAPGYAGSRVDGVEVRATAGEPLELRLARGVLVTVVVTGPDGAPLAGAGARLERTDAPGLEVGDPRGAVRRLFSGRATTDAAGELELGRFVPGTYELSVWRGAERLREPDVKLEAGDDERRVRVTLR